MSLRSREVKSRRCFGGQVHHVIQCSPKLSACCAHSGDETATMWDSEEVLCTLPVLRSWGGAVGFKPLQPRISNITHYCVHLHTTLRALEPCPAQGTSSPPHPLLLCVRNTSGVVCLFSRISPLPALRCPGRQISPRWRVDSSGRPSTVRFGGLASEPALTSCADCPLLYQDTSSGSRRERSSATITSESAAMPGIPTWSRCAASER